MTQFYLVRHTSEGHPNQIYKTLDVEAFCGSEGIISISVSLSLQKYQHQIHIHELSFRSCQFTTDSESRSFLIGHFGLPASGGIEEATTELLNRIKDPQEITSRFSAKWSEFSRGFSAWFNQKVKPDLLKEKELFASAFLKENDI
jgi:hypothetical protein